MVLERTLEFGPEKGIHQETHNGNKKHWVKHGNKTEGRHTEVTILWVGYSDRGVTVLLTGLRLSQD